MKKLYYYLIAGMVIVFLLILQQCNINDLKQKSQLQAVKLSMIEDSVHYLKTKNGLLIAKIVSAEVENHNKRKALLEAGYTISELKQANIRLQDITHALRAEISAEGSGRIELHDTVYVSTTDTVKMAEFNWNNRFLFLKGKVWEKPKKEMDFSYLYKTGIDILHEQKRKEVMVSVYLSDPNATITTANSISIKYKTHWYEKPWVWGAAGFVGGYLVTK